MKNQNNEIKPLDSPQVFPNPNSEDEIDLLEHWRTVLKHKIMIRRVVFATAIFTAVVSLLMTNVYRAEVLLVPVNSDAKASGGLASALGKLGGLASMTGLSLGTNAGVEENLAVLRSREFLWKFVQEEKLVPILFEPGWRARFLESEPPGQWAVYYLLIEGKKLDVIVNEDTGLITVAFEWKDPELAAAWANTIVARLNQHLAQQTIARSEQNLKYLTEELMRTQVEEMRRTLYDLIANEQRQAMLANTHNDFAFRVIDPAVAPDKKIKPKRAMMVIGMAFVAGFLAVLYAFIKEGMSKRREQELEQEKLQHAA